MCIDLQCSLYARGKKKPALGSRYREDLEPEVSADAIMAHVVVGTKILRDGGVPEPVVEFAYTHHGTQIVEYFFNKVRGTAHFPQERGVHALHAGARELHHSLKTPAPGHPRACR